MRVKHEPRITQLVLAPLLFGIPVVAGGGVAIDDVSMEILFTGAAGDATVVAASDSFPPTHADLVNGGGNVEVRGIVSIRSGDESRRAIVWLDHDRDRGTPEYLGVVDDGVDVALARSFPWARRWRAEGGRYNAAFDVRRAFQELPDEGARALVDTVAAAVGEGNASFHVSFRVRGDVRRATLHMFDLALPTSRFWDRADGLLDDEGPVSIGGIQIGPIAIDVGRLLGRVFGDRTGKRMTRQLDWRQLERVPTADGYRIRLSGKLSRDSVLTLRCRMRGQRRPHFVELNLWALATGDEALRVRAKSRPGKRTRTPDSIERARHGEALLRTGWSKRQR